MDSLFNELKKLEIKNTPFVNEIDVQFDTPMHFVKPLLVGQFKLSTKTTPSEKIRNPLIFVGLRTDKKASSMKSG
jgi:hypothetical protein